MWKRIFAPLVVACAFQAAFALPLHAQKFYTYVMDLGPDYVQLGWGTTSGRKHHRPVVAFLRRRYR